MVLELKKGGALGVTEVGPALLVLALVFREQGPALSQPTESTHTSQSVDIKKDFEKKEIIFANSFSLPQSANEAIL